jgi:hypothetical protein
MNAGEFVFSLRKLGRFVCIRLRVEDVDIFVDSLFGAERFHDIDPIHYIMIKPWE